MTFLYQKSRCLIEAFSLHLKHLLLFLPTTMYEGSDFFEILEERKKEAVVNTCLKLSRLPLTEPKTFSNFDFSYVHSNNLEKL